MARKTEEDRLGRKRDCGRIRQATASACGAGPCRALSVALVLLVAPLEFASAQPAFGAIGGVNLARFSGGGAVDVTSRTTFLVGVVGDIPVAENFSIRPELSYSRKGATVGTSLGDPADGTNKLFELQYIQLPLLAQLRPGGEGSPRPHLFAGMSVGALLGCGFGSLDCDDIEEFNQSTLDIGVLVGGEIQWQRMGLGARYETGIRAVDASIPGNEIYNGVLSFTVSYIFRQDPP